VTKLPKNRVARAVESNEPRGLMKVVVDSGTHPIVGAVVLGIDRHSNKENTNEQTAFRIRHQGAA
jgi:pyruvate/2-oxoglutarate dehydrogenase complex dihydrolipoamide dehydrogenase (E3) component